jgi:dephospho-CoA kinase
MVVLGITGGIGMGKSKSGDLLSQRNVPVVDTDILAREVVEPGEPALDEIVQTFGRDVLDLSGGLNRAELACRVFSDVTSREKLEAILHPRIRDRWQAQILAWRTQGHRVAAVIIPLLFETNAQAHCDFTIAVACSPQSQQTRLLARGWTPEQISQRLAAQWPTDKKVSAADFLIWTESSLEVHAAQLDRVLEALDVVAPVSRAGR